MRYLLALLILVIASPVLAQRDIKQKFDADTRTPEHTGWLIRAERSGVIAPAMVLPTDRNFIRLPLPKLDSTGSAKWILDTPPMDRPRVEPELRPSVR